MVHVDELVLQAIPSHLGRLAGTSEQNWHLCDKTNMNLLRIAAHRRLRITVVNSPVVGCRRECVADCDQDLAIELICV